MQRVRQVVLIVSVMLLSWLLMQAVHELGHAIGAWATGGRVTNLVLHPLAISRTDVQPNPQPLVVVWAGPVIGSLMPLAVWLVVWFATRPSKTSAENFLRFFAGFCMIANGAYIALGSSERIGDCGDMLRHGSPRWTLWLFGAVAIPAGLWIWHKVERPAGNQTPTIITLVALLCVIAAEQLWRVLS